MRIKSTVLIAVGVFVLSAVVCFAEQEKVDLKLRLKAGDSHEIKMTQTQDVSQTVNGQETNMKQVQEMVMGIDCLSVDADGTMDVQMTYKSVKMVMDGPMGRMEFDSANPKPIDPNRLDQKMMTAMVSAMAGCKFQMKVKPTGQTSDIRGIDQMLAKIQKEIPAGPEMEGMDEIFGEMFDEKQLEELTGNMMGVFPAEPIAVGDAWYDTQNINFMMPIDVDTTYMLKSRKEGISYIDAAAKIDIGDSSKPIEIDPNNKMSMQISGTVNASSEVNEKTGLTQKSNVTMNLSGVIKMEANEQMPQGMTIPMSIKGNAVVELLK